MCIRFFPLQCKLYSGGNVMDWITLHLLPFFFVCLCCWSYERFFFFFHSMNVFFDCSVTTIQTTIAESKFFFFSFSWNFSMHIHSNGRSLSLSFRMFTFCILNSKKFASGLFSWVRLPFILYDGCLQMDFSASLTEWRKRLCQVMTSFIHFDNNYFSRIWCMHMLDTHSGGQTGNKEYIFHKTTKRMRRLIFQKKKQKRKKEETNQFVTEDDSSLKWISFQYYTLVIQMTE